MIGLNGTSRLLRALADETRLRILNLLDQEDLSASDLMEILNMGQSRVSTHLAVLKEVGLVTDRRSGRRSLYRLLPGPAGGVWEQVLRESRPSAEFDADLAGLTELRRRRRDEARAYFDRVAASFGDETLPGRTWEGLARALLTLAPRARYCDLGIGDGLLTLMLAEVAERVTAVDVSPEMLRQLEARAKAAGYQNIETLEGNVEDLSLPDESYDVVILSQTLHYVDSPRRALDEANRILVRGGRLLVMELLAHGEDWVREKLGHKQLGFTEEALREMFLRAGFQKVRVQRAARDPEPPHFMTLVATASRG
jgi:ArsR family transcriptional regulator